MNRQAALGSRSDGSLGRRVNAVVLVVLLTGSLFPTVGGLEAVLLAAMVAIPLVLHQIVADLPRLHPVVPFVVVIFGSLLAHALLKIPVGDYGDEKLFRLATLTLLTAAAASLVRDTQGLVTFSWTWILASEALAISALIGGEEVGGRAVGFEGNNAIGVGRMLTTAVIMVIWLRWHRSLRFRHFLFLMIPLLAAIWATESRGPMMSALVGVALLFVTTRGPRTTRAAVLGILVVGGLAALALVSSVRESRVGDLLVGSEKDVTTRIRKRLWSDAWMTIPELPMGSGYGGYSAATGNSSIPYPHNLFLELTIEGGWLLGVAVTLTVLVIMIALWRRSKQNESASLVLAMVGAEALSVSVSGDLNARPFFMLVVLGYLVLHWTKESSRDSPRRSSQRESQRYFFRQPESAL